MDRHRNRHRIALAAVPALLLITAACSGSDDAPADEPTEEGDATMTESEQIEAHLATLTDQVVDDTSIQFTEGSDTISIGGLELTLTRWSNYTESPRPITMPPTWTTLDQTELLVGLGEATFGLSVFAQTDAVADPELRQVQIDQVWLLNETVDPEITHSSTTMNPDTGVVCFAEVEYGAREGRDPRYTAVLLFVGPDIAASGMVITLGRSVDVPALAGDVVESACGTRPDGL